MGLQELIHGMKGSVSQVKTDIMHHLHFSAVTQLYVAVIFSHELLYTTTLILCTNK